MDSVPARFGHVGFQPGDHALQDLDGDTVLVACGQELQLRFGELRGDAELEDLHLHAESLGKTGVRIQLPDLDECVGHAHSRAGVLQRVLALLEAEVVGDAVHGTKPLAVVHIVLAGGLGEDLAVHLHVVVLLDAEPFVPCDNDAREAPTIIKLWILDPAVDRLALRSRLVDQAPVTNFRDSIFHQLRSSYLVGISLADDTAEVLGQSRLASARQSADEDDAHVAQLELQQVNTSPPHDMAPQPLSWGRLERQDQRRNRQQSAEEQVLLLDRTNNIEHSAHAPQKERDQRNERSVDEHRGHHVFV